MSDLLLLPRPAKVQAITPVTRQRIQPNEDLRVPGVEDLTVSETWTKRSVCGAALIHGLPTHPARICAQVRALTLMDSSF